MESLTQELADFVADAQFDDLPQEVVHESKRLLLDSIGCALAGLTTDKGKLSVALARRLGGTPEATIIGIGDKLSCANAAFANGELINALDYDALMFAPGHVTPFVLPATLAIAESVHASGRELIVAVVLAHEVASRVAASVTSARRFVTEGPERGNVIWPSAHGYSSCIFGGTAGASKLLKLDSDKICHALGIAGHFCPAPTFMKWANTVPSTMTKYLSAGWISEAEVTATLLAELGYTGDKEVLNGELGFWRFYASDKWAPQAVTKRLGEDWRILRVSYKAYPCCAAMHSALNCFYKIIDENNLEPQDIEHVDVLLDPLSALPLWRNMEVETHIEAQFSVAYVFAVAAHRVRIGAEWQDSNTIKDARILEFMKKVSFAPHPDYGKAVLETATSNLAMVEVIARGRTFREEKAYFEGAAFPETARLKDEELIEKFEHNAATILTQDKIAKAVSSIWELEEIADVSELLKLVSL